MWSVAGFAGTSVADPGNLKKMRLEELMDVEVTSVSRRPEKLSEAAPAIQVITAEDIRRSGATSIPEALRLADNLDVAQKNSHDRAISACGFNTDLANKLLVLIDGRTVYTPLYSGVFWNIQDYLLEDIDHIEVISGPGGTLWGANAVNGVINISSKSAKDTQGLYAELGGGTQDRDLSRLGDGGVAADSWPMKQGGFRIRQVHTETRADVLHECGRRGDDGFATHRRAKRART
ncbi:MAG: TonB-dependent receptor plug domain-containing protein [Tahibacter sp.]